MSEEPPKLSICRILKEDQKTLVYSVLVVISLAMILYSKSFPNQPSLSNTLLAITAAIGGIAFLSLVRRVFLAIHLRDYGLLINGHVISSRNTASGHQEINYHFYIQGEEVHGTKEVLSDIVSSTGDIWVIVSPQNFANHMIVDLPTTRTNKEPEVPVFETPLVSLLSKGEREKAAPLTRDEVLAIRDNAKCWMVSESEAYEFYRKFTETNDVALVIINPERVWEEWQECRSLRDSKDRH